MNSILSLSPQDNRLFSAEIASALGDINAAVIVQQLHYWMGKEGVGTIIEGVKYVYNNFNDWVKQFPWLSVWQFRKAMKLLRDLGVVKVIRHKSKQWNQTNYYTLNSDCLIELIQPKKAEARLAHVGDGDVSLRHETPENSELWDSTNREVRNQQIEVRDTNISYIDTKKTIQKETANTERSLWTQKIAAAQKNQFEKENFSEQEQTYQRESNGLVSLNKAESEDNRQVNPKENQLGKCSINETKKTKIVNSRWRSLIEELDRIGVPINKTLVSLVKMYSEEEVEGAIALLKLRKREKHIPNLAGYFTAALKGGWGNYSLVAEDKKEVDTVTVFRLWYELAKELGYCSSQEMREGEQWVLISGNWERWEEATKRGYSLDYLKNVMRRNKRQN